MKIKLIFLSVVILFTIQSGKGQSNYVADGIPTEWSTPLPNYDSEAKLQYDFKVVDSNLFICVRISDNRIQMKVAMGGMRLYVEPKAKNDRQMYIQYPIKSDTKGMQGMGRGTERPNQQKMQEMMLARFSEYSTIGFRQQNGLSYSAHNAPIMAKAAYDEEKYLTIEYKIPLNEVYTQLPVEEQKMKLVLVVSGLDMPNMDGASGAPSGGMPAGGMPPVGMGAGGMPPGGMGAGGMPPGGMGAGNFEEMQLLFQSNTIVMKTTLNRNKK